VSFLEGGTIPKPGHRVDGCRQPGIHRERLLDWSMRWLLILALTGCVYHPLKLTAPEGDTGPGGDAIAGGDARTRLDTWTDLGNSGVGPRDAPLPTSASGLGVSASATGAYLPDIVATETAIVVAWQESLGTPAIHVLRFSDGEWSSYDGSADGYVADGTRPAVALSSGSQVVDYEHDDSIAVVIFDGTGWSPYGTTLLITDPLTEPASQPSLAVGPDGAVVAYRTGGAGSAPTTGDKVRVRRNFNGWTNMAGAALDVSSSNGGNNPDLALMPTGGAPVVVWDADLDYNGMGEVYVRRLDVDTWATVGGATTLNDGVNGSATEPAVAINPGGRIAVAWLDTSPGHAAVYLRAYDPGGDWHAPNNSTTGDGVSRTEPLRPASAPDVAFPGDENFEAPIVTYVSHDGNTSTVHVRMPGRNGVSGWAGPTHPFYPSDAISWPTHSAYTPAVALIPSTGRPVVAWSNYTGSGVFQIYVKRYTCLSMWEPLVEGAETGVSDASTCAEAPSLKMSGSGEPTVAWQTWTLANSNWEIYLRAWTGHGWSGLAGSAINGGISNTPAAWWDSGWPSLALDTRGKPWVAWGEYLPAFGSWTVYLRALGGDAWAEMDDSATNFGVPLDGPSQFPSLAIGPGGTTWVAWLHGTGGLQLAEWDGHELDRNLRPGGQSGHRTRGTPIAGRRLQRRAHPGVVPPKRLLRQHDGVRAPIRRQQLDRVRRQRHRRRRNDLGREPLAGHRQQ